MANIAKIERMSYGPCAIAHSDEGKTLFVEGAVTGDEVRYEVVEDKATFSRARAIEILTPSEFRVQPPLEALVGGVCPWAILSYDAQLSAKRAHLVDALVRTAHFPRERAEELVRDTVASKRQWGYRNKLELAVDRDNAGRMQFGFYKEGTHDVLPVQTCDLAHKPIQKAPKALQGALRFVEGAQDLGIFRVGVRGSVRTKDVEVALWTKPSAFPRAQAVKTLKSALKTTSIVRVLADPGKKRAVKKVEVLDGKGMWAEELAGSRFFTSAPSFFQVNTAQAEKLVEIVMDGLNVQEGDYVADLYAGGGTFSIPLAKAGANVIAVEAAGSSVRDLRRNADSNQVYVEVVGGDTARELPELGELDALVVDPPRAGLAKGVVEDIAAAGPTRVAYVSCDPVTWARDVAIFERNGYKLIAATPVDLFPQTYHVETASIFARV